MRGLRGWLRTHPPTPLRAVAGRVWLADITEADALADIVGEATIQADGPATAFAYHLAGPTSAEPRRRYGLSAELMGEDELGRRRGFGTDETIVWDPGGSRTVDLTVQAWT